MEHNETRRNRIDKIKVTMDDAKEKGYSINKEQLIAKCCIKWGCTRRTVMEYMDLINTDVLVDWTDSVDEVKE